MLHACGSPFGPIHPLWLDDLMASRIRGIRPYRVKAAFPAGDRGGPANDKGGRPMNLRIVTADQRLAEANGKTTLALFGPSGVGKTTLLKTLPAEETLCASTSRRG